MIKRLISFLLIIFVLIHCKNKNEKPVISAEVDSTEETVKKPVNNFTNIEFENTSKTNWKLDTKEHEQDIPIIAKRIEGVPGTHTVDYSSQVDTIEIKHIIFN